MTPDSNIPTLDDLWQEVERVCAVNYPDNGLYPIPGGGAEEQPDICFVFINPTTRNQSSAQNWKGPRYPFLGTKEIWRIFYQSGWFSGELMERIEQTKAWPNDLALSVLEYLKLNKIYFTNVVKHTGADAALPIRNEIELFLPILKNELKIVHPKMIVAFGLIPFEALTKQKIKLNCYYQDLINNPSQTKVPKFHIDGIPIYPCYFPVGRGNPKRAVEILKIVRKNNFGV